MIKGLLTSYNVDIDVLPPLMKYIAEVKREYKDDIVLFRVGDFFESYFEDAPEVSRILDIVLTAKPVGKKDDKLNIPMSGIPHRSLNDYALKIVNENRRVVVVEQLQDPKEVKKGELVKRGVVRIITKSTLVEEGFISEYLNNYLCVISKKQGLYGLCFSDVSTGETYLTSTDSVDGVLNELSRYKPSELLLNSECNSIFNQLITKKLKIHINITIDDSYFLETSIFEKIKSSYKIDSIDSLDYNELCELHSLYAFLCYVDFTQRISVDYGSLPISYVYDNYMILDIDTRRNLELSENVVDRGKQGTLLSILDKTRTSMGSRLLRQYVDKPLVDKSKIDLRLSSVEDLLSNPDVCEGLRADLSGIFDIYRILGRLKLNKAVPRDLVSLKESLKHLPSIKNHLSSLSSTTFVNMYSKFNSFENMYYLLDHSILDDAVTDIRDGLVLKNGYNADLDKYRDIILDTNKYLSNLEEKEREATGIKNLKITNIGSVCSFEVTNSNISKVPPHYIFERELKNCKRYKTEGTIKLESDLLSASERSKSIEIDLYEGIKDLILLELKDLSRLCDTLSTIDVLCSLSTVSKNNNYVRPLLNIDGSLLIIKGRHPVVENYLNDEVFVPNDILMNTDSDRFLLITGPNMAGKSTYMRQIALITIMSHIGCFVPATYANIPITDKVFTRIGASDDISSGRSTYMVEMEEVCNILLNATPKSLVLLDEVGRGTSTSDGLSIAQAISEYIHSTVGCKTLFATHYHELIRLEKSLSGLKNYHMSVGRLDNNELEFLRKIEKGGLSDSYGIDVAKLAGIPIVVTDRAQVILESLEDSKKPIPLVSDSNSNSNRDLVKELKSINVSDINPLSSYKYLRELVEWVNKI